MFNDKLNSLESKIDSLIDVNKKLKEENLNLKDLLDKSSIDSSEINIKSKIIDSDFSEKEKIVKEKIKDVLKKIDKLEPLI